RNWELLHLLLAEEERLSSRVPSPLLQLQFCEGSFWYVSSREEKAKCACRGWISVLPTQGHRLEVVQAECPVLAVAQGHLLRLILLEQAHRQQPLAPVMLYDVTNVVRYATTVVNWMNIFERSISCLTP